MNYDTDFTVSGGDWPPRKLRHFPKPYALILAVLFLVFVSQSHGAVAFNSWTTHYAGSGTNSFSVTVNAGSGSNYGCVLFAFHRAGSVTTAPTCGAGNTMTHVTDVAGTVLCFLGTTEVWAYSGAGISGAGTITFSLGTSGIGAESQATVFILDGVNQNSNGLDAFTGLATGNMVLVSGGQVAALPITTVADNSIVLGQYCPQAALTTTPSSNAIYAGVDGTGFGLYYWYSSPNATPAGSYSLLAKSGGGSMATYEANGISIKPVATGPAFQPRPRGGFVQ